MGENGTGPRGSGGVGGTHVARKRRVVDRLLILMDKGAYDGRVCLKRGRHFVEDWFQSWEVGISNG